MYFLIKFFFSKKKEKSLKTEKFPLKTFSNNDHKKLYRQILYMTKCPEKEKNTQKSKKKKSH